VAAVPGCEEVNPTRHLIRHQQVVAPSSWSAPYVQTDLEADRQVATTLAELILGGALASAEIASESNDDDPERAA
jgi:hypothetical protein